MLFPIAYSILAAPLLKDLGRFTVASYVRKEFFAGKLGNRVEETLVVEQNGSRYTIAFPRWHTRFSRQLQNYCPGEQVTVDGTIKGERIIAERSKVKNLLPPHRHDPKDGSISPG